MEIMLKKKKQQKPYKKKVYIKHFKEQQLYLEFAMNYLGFE